MLAAYLIPDNVAGGLKDWTIKRKGLVYRFLAVIVVGDAVAGRVPQERDER